MRMSRRGLSGPQISAGHSGNRGSKLHRSRVGVRNEMHDPSLGCRLVIPATQKVEAEGLQLQSQPGFQNEFNCILSILARPCLKI